MVPSAYTTNRPINFIHVYADKKYNVEHHSLELRFFTWGPISSTSVSILKDTPGGEWVLSKFNGTSTPKGSYRAKPVDTL